MRLILAGCCAFIAIAHAGEPVDPSEKHDFRQATCGMTQAQTLATESARPSEVRETGGETIVLYDSVELASLPSRLVYIYLSA